jgi:hypothetical protein
MTSRQMNLFRSIMRQTSRFFILPSKERWLLISAFLLLWAVRVGLWVLKFSALDSISKGRKSSHKQTEFTEEQIVWSIKAASAFVLQATCLTQAITARFLLSRYGYGADLRIGVLRENDQLKAHAWLENEGRVLMGGRISEFIPLPLR